MNADWLQTTVGDLLSSNSGGSIKTGPFGTKLKAAEYTSDGVPVISVGEVDYGRLTVHSDTPRVNESVTTRMPEYLLRVNDIVFGRKGAVDRSALVKEDQDGWFLGSDGIRLRLPTCCDATFVAYQFQLMSHRSWMLQHAAGTTMPSLNEGIIRRVPILLPPVQEQKRIAALLCCLDDKIEQNRRTGRKLEEMARGVFKAWFVDFEPVKAKAAGQSGFCGMPPAAFAALPARFVNSELGPVPEGWNIQPVSEAFEVNPTRRLAKGQVAAYLDMQNMPTQGHCPSEWERRPVGSGMKFINGDTLVARITPCLENGKTAFVDFLEDGEVACGSTEYIVLRPKSPLPPIFGYCLARMNGFREFAIQNMTGTSGRQRVSASAMAHIQIAVPPNAVAAAFGEVVAPFFKSIGASMTESRKLAALRDYLLPRLLSGKVRVKGV
jgi:type I restriction enzyme S subunit